MCKYLDLGKHKSVSLTLIPGKVMEQILFKANSKQVKNKKMTRSSHYGFVKGKSCLNSLISSYNEMPNFVDNGKVVDVVYLEFHKLFNVVSH